MGWRHVSRVRAVATVVALCGAVWLTPRSAHAQPMCVGDCQGDGQVSIDDLITGVDIVLGTQPLSACPAMDVDQSGTVTIADLIRAVASALDGCAPTVTATEAPAAPTPTNTPVPTVAHFCDLPGSYQQTMPGVSVVPGAATGTPDLSFLNLPAGFCAHYYAHVGTADSCCIGPADRAARGNVRQLRFAPGGELFITSPTASTTGGCGCAGAAAMFVLPDDDRDGVADAATVFLSNLPMTQGLLFANGYLYYQDGTKIMRLPYAPGDRAPSGAGEQVADIDVVTHYSSVTHWPKTLDIADDGTIYVANGGDQTEHTASLPPQCLMASADRPFHGGILKLDDGALGGATEVAKGFRNPISIRCARNRGQCFAVELALDYAYDRGREKLVPIRQGDDWGFPCCATQNLAYSDYKNPLPDCSGVASEIGSFFIGHTPFDVDFETGKWPEPWKNSAYIALHGEYGDWVGEGIVAIDYDAMTGNFLPGSDLTGMLSGSFHQFASGWEKPQRGHGRPANLAFAPDGRLFVGNDVTGDIFWIAPLGLERQP